MLKVFALMIAIVTHTGDTEWLVMDEFVLSSDCEAAAVYYRGKDIIQDVECTYVVK